MSNYLIQMVTSWVECQSQYLNCRLSATATPMTGRPILPVSQTQSAPINPMLVPARQLSRLGVNRAPIMGYEHWGKPSACAIKITGNSYRDSPAPTPPISHL